MNMRGFSIVFLLIIIALVVAGAGWWYLSNSAVQTSSETTMPAEQPFDESFLHFSYPKAGTILTKNDTSTRVAWSFTDPAIAAEFPDFAVYLILIRPNGDYGSLVGTNAESGDSAFVPLTQPSIVWNVAHQIDFWSGTDTPFPYGTGFKIGARLQYIGKAPFTCDPAVKGECEPVYAETIQSKIERARQFYAESEAFTITE